MTHYQIFKSISKFLKQQIKPFLLLLSTCQQPAYSQQTPTELNLITLTATLQPQKTSTTGRNITSIPGEYFYKLPVHSLDELLRYLPGVEVQQRGPAGSQSDIVLRGGTFQQVLMILDGLRLNDPITGHFNGYIPIAPAEIEKIEILKGAATAIYGSEAVGDVINITTKTFKSKKNQHKLQTHGEAMIGEYKMVNLALGGFSQNKGTAIAGGILSNNSIGQPQRGGRGFFYNNTGSISFKQVITDELSIAVRTSFDRRKFAAQNFYTTFVTDTAREEVNSSWSQAFINYNANKHAISLNAGYKEMKDWYQYNEKSTANDNKSKLLQLLVTDHFSISANTSISTGFQYQDKRIASNDRGIHSNDQAAAFLILNQQWNNFSISPAIRVDYAQIRGTEFVPQLNLSLQLKKWQLRSSAGKTIRDADFTERYNNYNKTFVSGGNIGNPNLEAERSFSYEVGADYFAMQNLKISSSVFQRRQSDLIDWVTTPYADMPRKDNLSPTGTYALATNIGEVVTTGAETDIQFTKAFNKKHQIISTLGLVWLDSKSSNTVPSFYISSHARFLTNLSFEYSNKIFSISATGIYKNRKAQEATAINAEVDANCFMFNTKASIFLYKQRLAVFMEMDNILDNTCGDLLGSQQPGRWLMGGLKFNFTRN